MIELLSANNFRKYIDFAWELSQNDLYASYPRRTSINEVKEKIEKAINSECENAIACYHQSILCGICVYHWDCDEKYVQTTQFLIKENYDKVAEELISYIGNQLPKYKLLIGVPFSNESANQYFKKKNTECIESSIDTRLYNLKLQMNQSHDCVEKITEDNFEEYAIFHDKYAIPSEIYYNSKNLKKDMNRFQILTFRKDGLIHGSIFTKVGKDISEVFGVFIDEEYKNNGIESVLINEMLIQLYNEFGSVYEIVYFIDENYTDELNSALNAGFEIKDKYRCYKYEL